MKKSKNRDAGFKRIIFWPIIFSLILIASAVYMFLVNREAAVYMTVFIVLYAIAMLIFYIVGRSRIKVRAIEYAKNYCELQMHFMEELSVPYAFLDENGKILWVNKEFERLVKRLR